MITVQNNNNNVLNSSSICKHFTVLFFLQDKWFSMLLFYKHIFDYCVFFTTHIILYQACISHLLFGQKHPVNFDRVSKCLCLSFKPNFPPYPHVPQYTSQSDRNHRFQLGGLNAHSQIKYFSMNLPSVLVQSFPP